MTVSDLIMKLSGCDPDAKVIILGEHVEEDEPIVEEFENAFELAMEAFSNPGKIRDFSENYGGDESGRMVAIWEYC